MSFFPGNSVPSSGRGDNLGRGFDRGGRGRERGGRGRGWRGRGDGSYSVGVNKPTPQTLGEILQRDNITVIEYPIYPMEGVGALQLSSALPKGKIIQICYTYKDKNTCYAFVTTGRMSDQALKIGNSNPRTIYGKGYFIHQTNRPGTRFDQLLVYENPKYDGGRDGGYLVTFDGRTYPGTMDISVEGKFGTKLTEADKNAIGSNITTINPLVVNFQKEKEESQPLTPPTHTANTAFADDQYYGTEDGGESEGDEAGDRDETTNRYNNAYESQELDQDNQLNQRISEKFPFGTQGVTNSGTLSGSQVEYRRYPNQQNPNQSGQSDQLDHFSRTSSTWQNNQIQTTQWTDTKNIPRSIDQYPLNNAPVYQNSNQYPNQFVGLPRPSYHQTPLPLNQINPYHSKQPYPPPSNPFHPGLSQPYPPPLTPYPLNSVPFQTNLPSTSPYRPGPFPSSSNRFPPGPPPFQTSFPPGSVRFPLGQPPFQINPPPFQPGPQITPFSSNQIELPIYNPINIPNLNPTSSPFPLTNSLLNPTPIHFTTGPTSDPSAQPNPSLTSPQLIAPIIPSNQTKSNISIGSNPPELTFIESPTLARSQEELDRLGENQNNASSVDEGRPLSISGQNSPSTTSINGSPLVNLVEHQDSSSPRGEFFGAEPQMTQFNSESIETTLPHMNFETVQGELDPTTHKPTYNPTHILFQESPQLSQTNIGEDVLFSSSSEVTDLSGGSIDQISSDKPELFGQNISIGSNKPGLGSRRLTRVTGYERFPTSNPDNILKFVPDENGIDCLYQPNQIPDYRNPDYQVNLNRSQYAYSPSGDPAMNIGSFKDLL